jgi:hypothetical protein
MWDAASMQVGVLLRLREKVSPKPTDEGSTAADD